MRMTMCRSFPKAEVRALTSGRAACLFAASQVVAGATLEFTTAQFWSTAGDSELEQEVEFHGVTADPASAFIDGSAGLHHICTCLRRLRGGCAAVLQRLASQSCDQAGC